MNERSDQANMVEMLNEKGWKWVCKDCNSEFGTKSQPSYMYKLRSVKNE